MAQKRELAAEDSPNKRAKVDQTDATQEDQERAVGISVYVSPAVPGFQCVVKQRYTDFLVNEIEMNGNVLHLNDVASPKSVRPAKVAPSQAERQAQRQQQIQRSDALSAWNNAAVKLPNQYSADADAAVQKQKEPVTTPPRDDVIKEIFKQTSSTQGRLGGPRRFEKPEYTIHDGQGSRSVAEHTPAPRKAQPNGPPPTTPPLQDLSNDSSTTAPVEKAGPTTEPKTSIELKTTAGPETTTEPKTTTEPETAAKAEDVPSQNGSSAGDGGVVVPELSPTATPVEKEVPTAEPETTAEVEDVPSHNGASAHDAEVKAPELSSADRSTLEDIFGSDVTTKINNLYGAILRNPHRKPKDHPTVRSDLISEKAKRTGAHKAVRDIFASKLQTETLQDEPGVITIKATPTTGPTGAWGRTDNTHGRGQNGNAQGRGRNNNAQGRGKLSWDELGGEYLHFTLYKENRDTMEALRFAATQLKIPAKNFEFAGTKDRRGITVQKVAAFRIRAENVAGLNSFARGWKVGGIEYKKRGLDLGELVGNEFVLTLRDVRLAGQGSSSVDQDLELVRQVVSEAAESFKTKGFLNYYGLQRFGSFSIGTHVTGMKILQGDLEGAVNSILSYQSSLLPENAQDIPGEAAKMIPRDDIARADCIRLWRDGKLTGFSDIKAAMPRRFGAETAMMQYLDKRDKRTNKPVQATDWQGALMQINRNLRLMYVHAYQSLVWNAAAGKRWELYGDKVVEGDLVIVGEKDDGAENGTKDEVDQDGELVVRPTGEDSLAAQDSFTRARPLSKEEAESGKYDIFDVVLPQPGFDVVYPGNEIGEFYKEFMGSEAGGKLDPYNMRRSWKDASLSGSYRKMMARPLNGLVEWEVKQYEDDNEQMCETDLERLRREGVVQEPAPRPYGQHSKQNGAEKVEVDVKAEEAERPVGAEEAGIPEGAEQAEGGAPLVQAEKEVPKEPRIAVVMKFQLSSSQYATMALRELTKGGARAYKPEYNTAR